MADAGLVLEEEIEVFGADGQAIAKRGLLALTKYESLNAAIESIREPYNAWTRLTNAIRAAANETKALDGFADDHGSTINDSIRGLVLYVLAHDNDMTMERIPSVFQMDLSSDSPLFIHETWAYAMTGRVYGPLNNWMLAFKRAFQEFEVYEADLQLAVDELFVNIALDEVPEEEHDEVRAIFESNAAVARGILEEMDSFEQRYYILSDVTETILRDDSLLDKAWRCRDDDKMNSSYECYYHVYPKDGSDPYADMKQNALSKRGARSRPAARYSQNPQYQQQQRTKQQRFDDDIRRQQNI